MIYAPALETMLVINPIIFCLTLSAQRIFSFQMHAQKLLTHPYDGSVYAHLISTNYVYVLIPHIALWKELFVRPFYAHLFGKVTRIQLRLRTEFSEIIRFPLLFFFPVHACVNVMCTDFVYAFRNMV